MSTPVRIQRSRKHKQVSPNGLPIVYVGRPGKWGNKYQVGKSCIPPGEIIRNPFNPNREMIKDVETALKYYTEDLNRDIHYNRLKLSELKGKNLSCWCKIGEPCHADTLLKLANE